MNAPDATQLPAGDIPASIGQRAAAHVLDACVGGVPLSILMVVVSGGRPSTDAYFLWTAVFAAFAGIYHTVCIRLWGRTIGKTVMNTLVVRAEDGGKVDGWSASIRALVPLVAAAVPVIGIALVALVYGMALRDPRRQGLHDRAAGTLVVRR